MATFDVLVVDDEEHTREGLAELLAVKRISTDTAPDGRTALQKLDTEDFRVVLLDVRLPDIDGLDVLARCARVRSPARIIMMTGIDTSETVLAALRGKAYDFLPKPVNPTALVETVCRAIAQEAPRPIEVLSARPEWVELLVPCTRDAAERIQNFVQRLEADLPDEVRESVGLAFRELLLNGIEWGGKLDPHQHVRVACLRTPRLLVFRIADPGEGFSAKALPHALSADAPDGLAHENVRRAMGLRPGGFGLVLIQTIADELIYNERQNEVLFVKYLERPADATPTDTTLLEPAS